MDLRAVEGLPEIDESDDIASLLSEIDPPGPDTVVVVASTIVSKAEGRGRSLEAYEPSDRARTLAATLSERRGERKDPRFAQAVLEESEELLIEDPFLLTVTHFGHITVNAGIDRSNLPPGADLLLLPTDPNASATRIRDGLEHAPPVIVADTCGRPFRVGQRGVAIGWAGMAPTRDYRGSKDRQGRELAVTVEAVADELAAAANLVAGEAAEGLPVVYVADWDCGERPGTNELFRDPEEDFIRQALRSWSLEE